MITGELNTGSVVCMSCIGVLVQSSGSDCKYCEMMARVVASTTVQGQGLLDLEMNSFGGL